jgi:hypothetical protein
MEAILTGLVTGVKWNPFASREGRERKRESERERERERERSVAALLSSR